MSKAFDKLWHEVLIFKLKQNSISGNFLKALTDFLKLRIKGFLLHGQMSSRSNIESAGVPYGSILSLLLFLIYIDYLLDGIATNGRLFADVSIFSVVDNVNLSATLNSGLSKINT